VRTGLYIDGAWRAASDGAAIEVFDPASEEVITSVASASIEDGLAAVDAAHRALPAWAATAPRRRAEILRKAFELMTARAEDLAKLMSQENGKALKDARSEAAYAAEFFRWYSEEAVRNISEISTNPGGTNRILVLQQPVGVSILVTPWNFPAAMATRKIGPALAAGLYDNPEARFGDAAHGSRHSGSVGGGGCASGRGQCHTVASLVQGGGRHHQRSARA